VITNARLALLSAIIEEETSDRVLLSVEGMLHTLAGMIPGALASMENEGRPEASPGFEDGAEALLDVARRTLTFREG
jgi:hypothetical protein